MRSPFYMLKFSMQVNKVMFDTSQNTGVGCHFLLQVCKVKRYEKDDVFFSVP